jgi:primosomal protein N' (replication factor Y)
VATEFPDAHRVILSTDLHGGAARMKEELAAVARGEADIIIGTQLVAKGHNFPKLTLVGVVDADLGLAHGDPRAAEKTFQLLQQVTGRAGRFVNEAGAARGLLQTYSPGHPVMQAIVAGDREAFYASEIADRRAVGLPPFGRLAGLIVSADDRQSAQSYARALALAAPNSKEIRVLGPTDAPLAVIRGRHRFRLLVKAERSADLQAYIRQWVLQADPPRGSVRLQVDIDPQSFL